MSKKRVKVLITGGAGFVGYHLARHLGAKPGNEIHLMDNLSRGRHDKELEGLISKPNVRFIKADITEPVAFKRLKDDYDYIYHLAAIVGVRNVFEAPDRVLYVNITATLNLLEWLKEKKTKVKRLVFSSTSEAYAGTARLIKIKVPTDEEVPLCLDDIRQPRTSYALSKIVGEAACRYYRRRSGLPVTMVRFHNVYGPRMGYDHVIPELLIKAGRAKKYLEVFSPGHSRAFCYIDDAVDALTRLAASKKADGELFNVGNPCEEISIKELGKKIIACVNPSLKLKPLSDHQGSPVRRCPDIRKLAGATGYAPRVGLEEGLRRTWEWYRTKAEDR